MNLVQSSSSSTSTANRAAAARKLPADPMPTHDALPSGTRLEEFQLERMIGASGFGIVYLASDLKLDRRIAIKEYLPITLAARDSDSVRLALRAPAHAQAFERGLHAFIDEAQVLARCDHPSLVHVLRSWEANGTAYRAMPYYAGTPLLTLRQALDEPPDEASLRSLLDGLLGALEVLHRSGHIHREISPANILLLPDDHPVLLDFSAARRAIVGEQTQALMTLLEPSFAPMEQIAPSADQPQGAWTDLYALAATVHYCVSGRLPASPTGWLPEPLEPLGDVVRRLQRNYPHVHYSAGFIAAIDAALATRTRDRPQSVAQFRSALDARPNGIAGRIEPALEHDPRGWNTDASREDDEPTLPPHDEDPQFAPTAVMPEPASPLGASDGAPAQPVPEGQWDPSQLDITTPRWPPTRSRSQQAAWWIGAALMLVAVGSAAWMFNQQRELSHAQTVVSRESAKAKPTAVREATPAPTPAPAAPPLPEAPTAAISATPVAAEPTPTTSPAALAPEPPLAAPQPVAPPAVNKPAPRRATTARSATTSPRQICGERSQFALYRCMRQQCATAQWSKHPQCKRLRARDEVAG